MIKKEPSHPSDYNPEESKINNERKLKIAKERAGVSKEEDVLLRTIKRALGMEDYTPDPTLLENALKMVRNLEIGGLEYIGKKLANQHDVVENLKKMMYERLRFYVEQDKSKEAKEIIDLLSLINTLIEPYKLETIKRIAANLAENIHTIRKLVDLGFKNEEEIKKFLNFHKELADLIKALSEAVGGKIFSKMRREKWSEILPIKVISYQKAKEFADYFDDYEAAIGFLDEVVQIIAGVNREYDIKLNLYPQTIFEKIILKNLEKVGKDDKEDLLEEKYWEDFFGQYKRSAIGKKLEKGFKYLTAQEEGVWPEEEEEEEDEDEDEWGKYGW